MCTMATVSSKVKALKALKAQRDELDTEITKLENWIKDEMTKRGEYVLEGTDWKVTWNMVVSSRFNQSAFQKLHPELYESFKTASESRRFLLM